MKAAFEKHVDWEPLHIRLSPAQNADVSTPEIQRAVHEWIAERDASGSCANCTTKFVDVRRLEDGIHVFVQWLCPSCVQRLLAVLAARFSQIEEARVGYPATAAPAPGNRGKFVTVQGRTVVTENGSAVEVAAFDICQDPVTVAEFEKFATEVGYLTSAEASGQDETYRDNGTLYSEDRRRVAEALFLSYMDAVAYCSHTGFRLPSDAELLAAITVDETERALTPEERASLFRDTPRLLQSQGLTITATVEGDLAVIRSGPWVTKHPGWISDRYRLLRRRDDGIGQIYIVRR